MKTTLTAFVIRSSTVALLSLAACLGLAPVARAGLSLEMNLIRYGISSYYFSPNLNTNTSPPDVPFGDYTVASSNAPNNGAFAQYHYDPTNGFRQVGGFPWGYNDFASFIGQLTNGAWSLFVTNTVETNVYYFNLTVNIDSNALPTVNITFPANGATGVTNQPDYTWQGPGNFSNLFVYGFDFSQTLPPTQTELASPTVLYEGMNNLTVHYDNYSTNAVVSSVPTDLSSHPISNWVFTVHLQDYITSQFSVGVPNVSGTTHALVAHYPFDASSGSALDAAVDASGNGYDMSFGAGFGGQGGVDLTADTAAGIGALQFHDGDGNSAGYLGWSEPTPPALLSTLAGSFTVSCWIKTSQNNYGWDTAPAYYGAGIVSADNGGQANDVIPIALTGNKVGFNTGGTFEDVTLNSAASVNDGNYHHVVVTRNQQTGQKIIYIDGAFDSFSSGTTNLLNDPQKLTIGALADASDPNPNDFNYYNGYDGKMDDLQIYSGALSASDVAYLFANPGSTVANGGGEAIGGHTNLAYYSFEDNDLFAHDYSGNGNNMNGYGNFGGSTNAPYMTNDAAAGLYAVGYTGSGWQSPPTNLVAALSGSFSVSLWAKTSDHPGNDSDTADAGAGLLSANYDQVIPMALTGNKLAFLTGGSAPDTLHSATSINTGSYVHLVVTRNQETGEKKIYVNGNLDATDYGIPGALGTSRNISLFLGMNSSFAHGFIGEMDEVQVYSGVLSPTEVAYLHSHPGTNIVDTTSSDFNAALNTTGLPWTTSGDSLWFVESDNTLDGLAAQSGSVTNNQLSTLSVTVTGPGTLTFDWSCIANDPNFGFDYEFDIDGNYTNDIYGDTSWYQVGPYAIGPGSHTLTWTTYAYGDTDPTQAGFLDQVNFSTGIMPAITLNPFSQTNYPGYRVWLEANATGNPAPTWQWYEVGSGAISGATSSYFIPANSGSNSVAGQYYAIASNSSGSAITTTAAVSFVSATLPPDWSHAFKSPFGPASSVSDLTKDYYYGCFVDASNNLYVAAEFGGNTLIGSIYLNSGTGGDGAAVVKQSPTGSPIWAAGITNNGSGSSYGQSVAPAPGGGVYLAGNYSGANWLGTNQLTDAGGGDMFLARFDANGSNLWVKTFGGANGDFLLINSLASDPSGNVTLSGLLGSGPVTIGTSNYNVIGSQGVLIQLDQTGAVRWSQLLPPSSSFALVQYLTYSAGRLYASLQSSTTGGTTNVVIGGVSNLTDRAWAVACLNETNGQAIWVRGVGARYGSSQGNPYALGPIDDVPRLAVSGTNVFLTGAAYDSSAAFGALTVNFGSLRGQYFARYDTNGNEQVATNYGSVTTTPVAAVADANGNVYVSGDFDGYSVFGNDVIAAPAEVDPFVGTFSQGFLAKFDRNGNALWAREAVSPATINFLGIALASDGVWASGWGRTATNILGSFPPPVVFGALDVNSDYQYFPIGQFGGYYYSNPGGVLAKITDSSTVALPVTILNPQDNGVNFQLSFLSQSGFTNAVQYRTNLVLGIWQTYSNVTGDGTLKTIPVPLSVFSPSPQGFIRVSTQ